MSNSYYLLILLGCTLVTWIPRILPFVLTKAITLPPILEKFLSYLPMTILTALLLQSLLNFQAGHFPTLRFPEVFACIPALIVGIRTNDLMKIVLTGVLGIALLRLF
ncbi:AzlD domain-containing protein [Enterococcus dongliensis]|uniref:AzlD domain-containing protein n=1 Tax=Enterococcus dongliensis TaxID=2559925 RepID=A0AAP5KNX8_9ENTE|nr:AzlD domain-containing protein [Enterococcus dongliensis]MDT2595692.1 AzlD domain-containing protein [Enterococcus dongliensis]MDT2602652.1 AzlD domain-containing protein [Enterococcus dongliensis]MDT2612113.1 AzlD domain-containing protein [Enterococcus dongliensis]MDT2633860.1 AzlD domain-containing protein [Enterococcus dongliensis]MDT2636304.1 AzlD domain-containing protein [Enterococcus dongliensis]